MWCLYLPLFVGKHDAYPTKNIDLTMFCISCLFMMRYSEDWHYELEYMCVDTTWTWLHSIYTCNMDECCNKWHETTMKLNTMTNHSNDKFPIYLFRDQINTEFKKEKRKKKTGVRLVLVWNLKERNFLILTAESPSYLQLRHTP